MLLSKLATLALGTIRRQPGVHRAALRAAMGLPEVSRFELGLAEAQLDSALEELFAGGKLIYAASGQLYAPGGVDDDELARFRELEV